MGGWVAGEKRIKAKPQASLAELGLGLSLAIGRVTTVLVTITHVD